MSNFLKNVVRRGAGLPLPTSIRPTIGPQQIPPSLVSSQCSAEKDPDLSSAEPARPPEPLTTTMRATGSGEPHASGPEKPSSDRSGVVAKQSPDRLATLQPVAFSSAATTVEITPITSVFDTGHPKGPEDTPHRTVHPTPEMHETTAPSPQRSSSTPGLQNQVLQVAPTKAAPQDTPTNSLTSTMRPAIEREQPPLLRASEPGGTAQTMASKAASQENRNIQVKIGRVEIRSSQPPTVVRATRPANTGGFDDFKLSRNYLDRNRC